MQHVERNLFNGERSPGGTFKKMYTKSATGGARVFENMAWSEKIEVLAYFEVSGPVLQLNRGLFWQVTKNMLNRGTSSRRWYGAFAPISSNIAFKEETKDSLI